MNQRRHAVRLLAALAVGFELGVVHPATQAKVKPMDEHTFWALVEKAKAAAGADLNRRPAALERVLEPLPLATIQAFQKQYEQLLLKANRWDLWGAAYVMNGGCSDDGFKYFRDWLISEGRPLFESALAAPDSLAAVPRREYFELELFGYAASKAFASKGGGGELDRDFMNVELAKPQGKEWDESDLPRLFPKLAAKYKLQ